MLETLFTILLSLLILYITIRLFFATITILRFYKDMLRASYLSFGVWLYARNPNLRKTIFRQFRKRDEEKLFGEAITKIHIDEKNSLTPLLIPVYPLSTFDAITDMIDLAFGLAPLLLLVVIFGTVFKLFGQFAKGNF